MTRDRGAIKNISSVQLLEENKTLPEDDQTGFKAEVKIYDQ